MFPRMLKVRLAAATAVGYSLFVTAVARAQSTLTDQSGLTESAGVAGLNFSETSLADIIGNILGGLIALLGIVFVVLLVYGGFTWMTAQGSEDKIKKAKGIISSAVIGLVVVFASYAIAQAVIGALATATGSAEEAPPDGG